MTFKQAKKLEWSGVRVVVDAGLPRARHARLWCADAKWTADMTGMATIQYVNENGESIKSGPYFGNNGHALCARRRLKLLSKVISS